MQQIKEELWKYLLSAVPRVITQFNREPLSSTRGSFDRNFWHYKIRDFSSITTQQGMVLFEYYRRFDQFDNPYYMNADFNQWVEFSLEFMTKVQNSNGSYNEYYPYECGIPPTGFGLYAMGIVLNQRDEKSLTPAIQKTIQKSIDYLLHKDEVEALNQESAGLAGIFLCSNLQGIHVDSQKLENKLTKFLSFQTNEGWFPEYHGPDLGYLSVTIDCLWDIYTVNQDKRVLNAIHRAAKFIDDVISNEGHIPVMINSRNTEYILPYGLMASGHHRLVKKLFQSVSSPMHFLKRIDDRYVLHYVFHSCLRALFYFPNQAVELQNEVSTQFLEESGFWIRKDDSEKKYTYIAARKGGVIYHYKDQNIITDHGWRILLNQKWYATHWQSEKKNFSFKDDRIDIDIQLIPQSGYLSTPLNHFVLRVASFLVGAKIIPLLKKMLIFIPSRESYVCRRSIHIQANTLEVVDHFEGIQANDKVEQAPYYSFRHVASAAGMSREEIFAKAIHFEKVGKYDFTAKLEI